VATYAVMSRRFEARLEREFHVFNLAQEPYCSAVSLAKNLLWCTYSETSEEDTFGAFHALQGYVRGVTVMDSILGVQVSFIANICNNLIEWESVVFDEFEVESEIDRRQRRLHDEALGYAAYVSRNTGLEEAAACENNK
jgi:hypothetical protein